MVDFCPIGDPNPRAIAIGTVRSIEQATGNRCNGNIFPTMNGFAVSADCGNQIVNTEFASDGMSVLPLQQSVSNVGTAVGVEIRGRRHPHLEIFTERFAGPEINLPSFNRNCDFSNAVVRNKHRH